MVTWVNQCNFVTVVDVDCSMLFAVSLFPILYRQIIVVFFEEPD
jgi:hypothetical protein